MNTRLDRVEHALLEMSETCATLAQELASGNAGEVETAATASRLLKLRRQRDTIFFDGLFSDPAWGLMLDLFVADAADVPRSLRDISEAAAAPSTTVQRWLGVLSSRGLIEQMPHPADPSATVVRLTLEAKMKLEILLGDL